MKDLMNRNVAQIIELVDDGSHYASQDSMRVLVSEIRKLQQQLFAAREKLVAADSLAVLSERLANIASRHTWAPLEVDCECKACTLRGILAALEAYRAEEKS